MDEMMSSVILQIQRAISDAISNQILPQTQNALRSGSGLLTQNRWNVPAERPEIDSEGNRHGKTTDNSRSEPIRERPNDESTDQAYDNVICTYVVWYVIFFDAYLKKTISRFLKIIDLRIINIFFHFYSFI